MPSNNSPDSVNKNLPQEETEPLESESKQESEEARKWRLARDMQATSGGMWDEKSSIGTLISRGADDLEVIIRGKKYFSTSALHLSFPSRKLHRVIVALMEALNE